MLFKQSPKVTFVMYQDRKVAKCFELSKRQITFLAWSLSILFFIAITSTLFLMGNIKSIKLEAKKQVPLVIQQLREKEVELRNEIAVLKDTNLEYLKKINTTRLETDTILPLFAPTLGFKDLSKGKYLNLENLDVEFAKNRINFNFNIVNNRSDSKSLAGYIFIIMRSKNKLFFYPEQELLFDDALSTFNRGETFNISRFREVAGVFNTSIAKGDTALFKIFIFSRTGDLYHQQTVGPVTAEF